MMNEEKGHSIRFINSDYDTLFHLPDGGTVEFRFPDRTFIAKCAYEDDYHCMVGDTMFHICQLAELVERQGGSVRPEPDVTADEAAWQLGHREYLAIQRTDTGYDYTLYSKNFRLIDGGQLDAPDLSMKEAREQILNSLGMSRRNRSPVPYGMVADKAEAAEVSVVGQLKELKKQSDNRQTAPEGRKEGHNVGKPTR